MNVVPEALTSHPLVVLCDSDGRIVACGMTEARHVALGRHVWDLPWTSPPAAPDIRDAVLAAARGEPSQLRVPTVAEAHHVTVEVSPVDMPDGNRAVAVHLRPADPSGRQVRALAELSAGLNGAETTDAVAELVIERGGDVVDADFVNLAVVDDAATVFTIAQRLPGELAERWGAIPVHGPIRTPLHDALESGRPVFVDPERRRTDYPALVQDTDRLGLRTTAALPLRDSATRSTFAVLGLGWRDDVRADSDTATRAELLADLCAQAYARCRRREVADQLLEELQRNLITQVSAPADLDVAVAYLPAERAIGFGGDWYDVVRVDETTTAVVVGDVAGHGITAAAHMASAKATIRTAIYTSASPDRTLPDASQALEHLGSAYIATAAIVWCRADGGVRWSLAGHPPPVLRGASSTELLAGPQHPPLGMRSGPAESPAAVLAPGGLLVLYTDGLVERRDLPIGARLEQLRRVVGDLPDGVDAETARDRILAEMLGSGADDDVAIVVVRRR